MFTRTEKVVLIQHSDGQFMTSDGSGYPTRTNDPTQASDYSWGDPGSIRRNYMDSGDKLVEYERIIVMSLIGEVVSKQPKV